MRVLQAIILTLAVGLQVYAQNEDAYNPFLQRNYNPMYAGGGIRTPLQSGETGSDKKVAVGVSLGTSFSSDFNRGFTFSTFVAPELRYNISDRFRVRGGLQVTNNEYGNTLVYSPEGIGTYTGNFTQGLLYVSGDYMISPGVILSGTAYKEFSIDHGEPLNAFSPGYEGKGLIMNLHIHPTDNVSFDVGAEFYQGNNPWRGGSYNPFHSPLRPYW